MGECSMLMAALLVRSTFREVLAMCSTLRKPWQSAACWGLEGSPRAGDDEDPKGQAPPRSQIQHSHPMSLESEEPRVAGQC